jgi:phage terminase small subunit
MAKVTKQIKPPAGLSYKAKQIWRDVQANIVTPGRAVLVESALRLYDEAEQIRAVIDAEGPVSTSARSGLAHCHPFIKQEIGLRVAFDELWRAVGLHRYEKE